MRVLVATHNYPRFPGDPAGAFVARLAAATRAAGHHVQVVAPHAPGTRDAEELDGVWVRRFRYAPEALERVAYTGSLHRTHVGSPTRTLGLLAFLAAFRHAVVRAVRDTAPGVIHAHWWMPAGWLATQFRTPCVVTCHGSDVRLLDRPWWRAVARRTFQHAGAVTAVSDFLADDLRHVWPALAARIHVARMPVDLELFARGRAMPKASPPVLLYAGNFVPSKGVDVLIEAVALLHGRGIACRLRLLGGGVEEGRLRALVRERRLDDHVTWSPFVPQSAMPAEYGASTVTVLPSLGHSEGLGLTLVEALLAGSAVVGSQAGGIPEVVVHEHSGLLARAGDPADLATQIARLLTNDALRTRLTLTGQAHVQTLFAPAAAADRFLDLYDHVAHARRPA